MKNHSPLTFRILICLVLFSFFLLPIKASNVNLQEQISQIRYQITAIEHEQGDRVAKYQELVKRADQLLKNYPDSAELYVWKAIALSAQAKYKGPSALSRVKEAKELLEKAIRIDPELSDGTAYNALAMLYYKVPPRPLSFGDDEKARMYFKKAISISSNIDTNYRYGEFLLNKGNKEEAEKYLQKALDLPNRPGRKEDPLKKSEIKALLEKVHI